MKLVYDVRDKVPFGKMLVFALQQLLAILAATIAVPAVINSGMTAEMAAQTQMSQGAALFGAGFGTLVYLLFTKFRSPVFLGSSFAFLGSMAAAFAGATSASLGYLGLIIGAAFAGLVYVIIALIVKFAGVNWINKLMPAVVIGPTVAIIGLSLAGNAVSDLTSGSVTTSVLSDWTSCTAEELATSGYVNAVATSDGNYVIQTMVSNVLASPYIALLCGVVTLLVTIICSVYGKKMLKMIPFIIGIVAGYALAAIFTLIGNLAGVDALKIIDFSKFADMQWYPDFTFITAFSGNYVAAEGSSIGAYIGTIAVAYIPVAFVVFAEHIADHKNISSIIEKDLLVDPGLHRTLLGDGVGSMVGAFFGGCPNTTYGESIGCVAISGNASVWTILTTAILCIIASFLAPFTTFLASIPKCVMGGVCIALYGFIAVSGLKMVQKVDLEDNRNLFVVSTILIVGIGGLSITFGTDEQVTITTIACALILGIIVNLIVHAGDKKAEEAAPVEEETAETTEATETVETDEETK